MRKFVLVLAIATATACAGDVPRDRGSGLKAIVGGTNDSADGNVVTLTQGIGAFCSATLVAPRVLVTAGHCVEGGSLQGVEAFFGADVAGDGTSIAVVEGRAHPDFDINTFSGPDIAVIALAEDAPVAPKRMNLVPFDGSFVGREVRMVGFGVDDPQAGDTGTKRQATTSVTDYDDTDFELGGGGSSSCSGDSGGPAFMTIGGEEVLVGVTSRGDDDCTIGIDTRVDVQAAAFVQPYIDGNGGVGDGGAGGGEDPGPAAGCGGVTYDGACDGGLLQYCENDELVTSDCAQYGMGCGCQDGWCDCGLGGDAGGAGGDDWGGSWDGGGGAGGDCGSVDWLGSCEGGVLAYCAEGQLQVVDCAELGATCDWQDDEIGFNCL